MSVCRKTVGCLYDDGHMIPCSVRVGQGRTTAHGTEDPMAPSRGRYCGGCNLWSTDERGCTFCDRVWPHRLPTQNPASILIEGVGPTLKGVKFDTGKARWDLLPTNALGFVVEVFTAGAEKYSPWNWTQLPGWRPRLYAAAMRHLFAWWCGIRLDPESGSPHLAHAATCILMLLELDSRAGHTGDPTQPAWHDPQQRAPWLTKEKPDGPNPPE